MEDQRGRLQPLTPAATDRFHNTECAKRNQPEGADQRHGQVKDERCWRMVPQHRLAVAVTVDVSLPVRDPSEGLNKTSDPTEAEGD